MQPYEIIGAPLTLWLAAVGTAFPDVDETPSGSWIKVGTSGDKNYTEDGVTVSHSQSVEVFRGAGTTGPRKAWRTEEDLTIGVSLADLSPAQYAQALNNAAVTTVAAGSGTPGTKRFDLQQGLEVEAYALLARGLSSVDEALAAQYEVPVCYQSGSPEVSYTKGSAAVLELEFTAIEDASSGFGVLRIQTAVAS